MGWLVGLILLVVVIAAIAQAASPKKKPKRPDSPPPRSVRPPTKVRPSVPAPRSVPRATPTPSPHQPPNRRNSGREFPLTWFGRDAEIEVAGIRIKGPCTYASAGAGSSLYGATDPSEIQIQAPVRRPGGSPLAMGYWPWYAQLNPEQRYGYLEWLASGRASLPSQEGYLFLYFYGIERRLLVDQADRPWGLQEIVRLRRLDRARAGTRMGGSFRGYSTGLLWFEVARTPHVFNDEAFDTVMDLTERWTPELLPAALNWLVTKERPLPAELARHIAAADPTAQRSVVIKRIPEEFEELFKTRYRDTFGGEGMMLRASKNPAWHTYRPASGGLGPVRCNVANPLGIRSQFKKLPDIWNSCIADLRKLSRVATSTGDGSLTSEGWEAMPPELRAEVDHPLAGRVSALLSAASPTSEGEQGTSPTMLPAGRFAELIGIDRRPTLTATQSQKLATTVEYTGYGLVPDARISPIRYGWDDLVAVVPGLDDDDVEPTRFNAAACVLRLGLSIAQADGEADNVELRMLTDHIDAVFDLSPEEQQRLAALRDLLLRTGSDIRPIARKIEETLPPDARRKVGRLLVVIAAATNGIDRAERAALRKAFRALGLPPELLEETITEVAPDADQAEVRVRPARAGPEGEPIPGAPAAPAFRLNHAAISSIMSETREVSVMLAAAMGAVEIEASPGDATAPEPSRPPPSPSAAPVAIEAQGGAAVLVTSGPEGRYHSLFTALIGQARWTREEADGVARSQGLMLDAGVEAINDWSYDALGAPLIEDEGDELVLDRSLLEDVQ